MTRRECMLGRTGRIRTVGSLVLVLLLSGCGKDKGTGGATDHTPPATVIDLAATSHTQNSVTLGWTAPGDDGRTGTGKIYDVRYSTAPITPATWASATQATSEPAPLPAGSPESFTMTGLEANTTYYIALETADEVPNWSELSNVAIVVFGLFDSAAPYKSIEFAAGAKPRVAIETDYGRIVVELWPDVAFKTCQSFVYLVGTRFFDGLTIHRVVPDFVIQGGDPLGNGTGGPGYTIPAEFSSKPHVEGTLSMARRSDINSAGSQFFLCMQPLLNLDGKYTVFGQVVEGLAVMHAIEHVPCNGERPVTPVYMRRVYIVSM
jgi:cyclophilin family peptidyl-prolyl cis-trans isomerase